MSSQLIGLAIIDTGARNQRAVNAEQVRDLRRLLSSFSVSVCSWTSSGRMRLRTNFDRGAFAVVLKNAYGRDHQNDVEQFLERYHIPYLGSDARAVHLGTSKYLSKRAFRRAGLSVADDICIRHATRVSPGILSRMQRQIGYPCVIKDVHGTDSRGLYLVRTPRECQQTIERIQRSGHDVLVEEYIRADAEVTCMVVGNARPTAYEPVGMERPVTEALLSAKHKDLMSCTVSAPARLSPAVRARVKKLSVAAHRALGCRTFSRADILIRGGRLYLLEVDVHPGFRARSATTLSAEYRGESLNDLFLKFYQLSLRS